MSNKDRRNRRTHSEPRNGRELALDVLLRIESNDSFSNLELKQALQRHRTSLEAKEKALATELVYGTLSRLNTLDWMANRFVSKGIGKLDAWVRQLLRLSFYQVHYLDRIPDRAVVHEAVEIAKKKGHKGIAGFMNGVLRQYLRHPEKAAVPRNGADSRIISLEDSHPEWLIKRWITQFGVEETREMARSNNVPPSVSIRINRLRTTAKDFTNKWRSAYPDVEIEPSSVAPEGMLLSRGGNLTESALFQDGWCTIQDESSMLVARAVDPQPGMRVLDACAAPGGKTTHMAERMDNKGEVVAVDIHTHKRNLIEENAQRLGIGIIETVTADSTKMSEEIKGQQFDRVLLDAPCSGLGVIRRKPDIKWSKLEKDLDQIVHIQYQLLEEVSKLVKPGGILVYSTCTTEPQENEKLLQTFISNHSSYSFDPHLQEVMPKHLSERYSLRDGYFQILPHHFNSDGFFIARLQKSKQ